MAEDLHRHRHSENRSQLLALKVQTPIYHSLCLRFLGTAVQRKIRRVLGLLEWKVHL